MSYGKFENSHSLPAAATSGYDISREDLHAGFNLNQSNRYVHRMHRNCTRDDVTEGDSLEEFPLVSPSMLFQDFDYKTVPEAYHIVVGTVLLIAAIFGSVANLVTIIIFSRVNSPASRILFINLAVCDGLSTAVAFPMMAIQSFSQTVISNFWVCYSCAILSGVGSLGAIGSMASIAFLRMMSVVKPHLAGSKKECYLSAASLTLSWLNAVLWCSLALFDIGDYVVDGIGSSCTFNYMSINETDRCFIGGLFLFAFGIPFTTIVIAYSVLIVVLKQKERSLSVGSDSDQSGITLSESIQSRRMSLLDTLSPRRMSKSFNAKERPLSTVSSVCRNSRLRRMSQTSFVTRNRDSGTAGRVCYLLILCFLICWTPYSVVSLIGLSGQTTLLNPYISLIAGLFAKLSAIYNPVIYFITTKRFRRHSKRLLCFKCIE